VAEVEQKIDWDVTVPSNRGLDRRRINAGGVLNGAPYQFRAVIGSVFSQVKASIKRDFPYDGRVKQMARVQTFVAVINLN